MIEIIDRKDSGKYATSGPAIQVVHTVDQHAFTKLLRIWAKDKSPKQIADLLKDADITPEIVTPNEGKFMVSVDGCAAPRMEHAGIVAANEEAERLARLNPNHTVRILQLVGWRRVTVTTTMTGEP